MNYVYLIRCNDNHYDTKYKIGVAQDVQTRLAQLQTGSPYILEVMECYGYENAEVVERALHQTFQKQRIQGEWFVLNYEQATEDFSKICTMLGGVVGIVEDKSDPEDVEEAEETSIPVEGAKFDYAAMFADGWTIDYAHDGKSGRNHERRYIYWAWRKRRSNEKGYIFGGKVSDLPYPSLENMRRVYRDNLEPLPITGKEETAEEK